MPLPEIELDRVLMKRWLKLFGLRVTCLLSHLVAILDGLNSIGRYPLLMNCYKNGDCDALHGIEPGGPNTTAPPIEPVVKKGFVAKCKMAHGHYKKDVGGYLFNFNMAFFLLMGFFFVAFINFIIKSIINFRLVLCPIIQEEDACGNKLPTKWHKARDQCFNFATFPCDTAILSCVAGLYCNKRGDKGLGCWQCFVEPTCLKEKDLDSILFMSSLSLNMNFFFGLIMVFYKGLISWYYATDPEKCDCHCEAPRCITGCFISLITTSVLLMPPFAVLSSGYYDLKGVKPNLFSQIMGNMKLIGIIIWACIGLVLCIVVPIKIKLARSGDKK